MQKRRKSCRSEVLEDPEHSRGSFGRSRGTAFILHFDGENMGAIVSDFSQSSMSS